MAKLSLHKFAGEDSEGSSDTSPDLRPPPQEHHGGRHARPPPHRDRGHPTRSTYGHTKEPTEVQRWNRNSAPKLVFPSFDGVDPKIWHDKCEDYFRIMDVPEYMWVTSASMHMTGNSAKWARVLRCKGGLGTWDQFMNAVETKFGAYDHIHALENLLELQQTGAVDEYVEEFENLQFQIEMHNTGYDKTFFITQFTRGLKPDIGAMVHSQVPQTMERAIMLAKVQQHLLDKGKVKSQRITTSLKQPSYSAKPNTRSGATAVSWSKERQKRDFCKANNLCFYCSEPFDASHLAKCTKRPRAQMNALVVNDLDVELTDEVLK